jgi:DNA ligase-1
MTPWEIIAALESTSSRLDKEEILRRELSVNEPLRQGLVWALDSLVTFGVKKVPEHTDQSLKQLPTQEFHELLQALSLRQLTGHAARDAIAAIMAKSGTQEWNTWYRRILLKDLKCGVSETTINKVAKSLKLQYEIPVFTCQLAHDGANHEAKIRGKKLIEVKLDGVRVLTIVYPDGRVNQYSRNGKELVNFELIREQFAQTKVTTPWVFDGEVMSSSFQDLMRQVHRKSDVRTDDAVLHLFDMVPLEAFLSGKYSSPQIERSEHLRDWKNQWDKVTPNIEILNHTQVDLNTLAGQKQFADINKRAIEGGYEGIMIKSPQAPYENKRTTHWLKQKPYIEVSLVVVGLQEGTGKNEGKLGALVCQGEDDGKFITVNVGSGFTDSERDEFWAESGLIIDLTVEVRADAITQNQDGTYSLRFPRFKTFRGFVPGDKI